jgi:hypothetical protein
MPIAGDQIGPACFFAAAPHGWRKIHSCVSSWYYARTPGLLYAPGSDGIGINLDDSISRERKPISLLDQALERWRN